MFPRSISRLASPHFGISARTPPPVSQLALLGPLISAPSALLTSPTHPPSLLTAPPPSQLAHLGPLISAPGALLGDASVTRRKLGIKLLQRVAIVFLPPRLATWR